MSRRNPTDRPMRQTLIKTLARSIISLMLSLSAASCGSNRHGGESLAQQNADALTESIDMQERKADADGRLVFDRTTVRMGELTWGQTRRATIRATNRTDAPLAILRVWTSCGCTKVEYERQPVPAGGTTEFSVVFTAETKGVFSKKVAVAHSAAARPVSFTIEGTVVAAADDE